MWIFLLLFFGPGIIFSADIKEADSSSRKILGSSVVTSVSVIMDTGNGTKATFSDAVGKPVSRPQASKLASPIELLNPDRYEFYTFDDSGDLVKRLMTMDEIRAIIATSGDDLFNIDNLSDIMPEKRVNDIVTNVQNVLKEEMESHKIPDTNQLFDTPDVSDSWSMILPAIFGNSGEEIKPEKTVTATTPETIVIGPTQTEATSKQTTRKPTATSATTTTTTTEPSPVSRFTTYFTQSTKTDAPKATSIPQTNNTTSSPRIRSTTHRPSSNNVFILNTTKLQPTSTQSSNEVAPDSTTLKVQIFPNSNTNLAEEPYSKLSTSGTTSKFDFVRIRTPKPEHTLESRISSTTLDYTSPFTTWNSDKIRTPDVETTSSSVPSTVAFTRLTTENDKLLTHPPLIRSTTQKSSISTRSTPEYVKINTAKPEPNFGSRISTTTSIKPTTLKQDLKSSKPEILPDTTNVLLQSTTTKPSSEPTEKIYILLRPLSTSGTSVKYETVSSTTEKEYGVTSGISTSSTRNITHTTIPSRNGSTQSIFTTISQKPTIVTVPYQAQKTTTQKTKLTTTSPKSTSQTISYPTKNAEDNKINSSFSNQSLKDHTTFVPLSTITKSPITHFQSPITEHSKHATLPTLADILNNKSYPDAEISSSSTEYLLLPASSTYVRPETTDISLLRSSTISELQNLGSVSSNKYTPSKTDTTEAPTTYTTELVTETMKTESSVTEKTTIDNSDSTEAISTIFNRELLEKLLLSSTNVYEINSAVNQKLTYPLESTSTTEVPTTEILIRQNEKTEESNQTLIESFGQLLAQAVGNINEVILKENKTDITTNTETITVDVNSTELSTTPIELSTKYPLYLESTTISTGEDITEVEEIQTPTVTESRITTNSLPLLGKLDDSEEAHIINVTIIRKQNTTKPAKADFSLETDYDLLNQNYTEMQKLTTRSSDTSTVTSDIKYVDESTISEETVSEQDNEPTTYLYFKKTDKTSPEYYYTSTLSDETSEPNTEFTQNITSTIISSVPAAASVGSTVTTEVSSPASGNSEDTWTLVSTIAPHSKLPSVSRVPTLAPILEPTPTVDLDVKPMQGFGLEESTSTLDTDVYQFVQLCNELAFGFWKSVTTGISTARSVIVSPFAATSLLAMVFLGARGATSGEMNEILKLDNMVTFNPHLIFKTVTESIVTGPDFGVATSAIVRQLYSDKSKESILNFYKERARFFYDGHVEEVSFRDVGDTIRRRTNLLVKKQTNGKVQEFLKDGSVRVRSPLAAVSASVMQTDCTKGSITDRDGEIHFVVFPSIKQRRLIPIPAVVYRSGFLAGYEPSLDATAVALGDKDDVISYIFVLPGRQGINALGDGLSRLEKRLVESSFQKGAWGRLLRSLVPRPGLEVQIPRFSHRSIINATSALKQMGLKSLFDLNKADLRGLNGVSHDLHLSDMLQFNYFSVCGNANSGDTHHSEYYPATARRSLRKHRRLDRFEQQKILHDDPLYLIDYLSLPLNLRPRQARVPQVPRLRLDRPFLYFVRHNPTGLILHMGRFNPRLLP